MSKVSLYGNPNAFNIQIFAMSGGGYYAILCDGNTQIFQRRNSPGGQDTILKVNGLQSSNILDHFISFSYNIATKTLTLSGAVDAWQGITFTRQETYKFISDYVVENTWKITADIAGGGLLQTNWNIYTSPINAVIDISSTNFGDGTINTPLGFGIQLNNGGFYYGAIADNPLGTQNNTAKRSLASQSAVASIWVTPNSVPITLNSTNNNTLSLTQWFYRSNPSLYDFELQGELALALAKGYTGSLWDKICQVTSYLNRKLTTDLTTTVVIPSFNYRSQMFGRDSFWQSFTLDNTTEQALITYYESFQDVLGRMSTSINIDGVTLQYGSDESTLMYIIRAYYDKIMRGLTINQTVLTNAYNYILTRITNDYYVINGTTHQDWIDNFIHVANTSGSYNQGLYCVALKCAKKLGLTVSTANIANAIIQYQGLYDWKNKFMKFTSAKDYISTSALVGESLSYFLFNEKMLTDDMVINTIIAISTFGMTEVGAKNLCTKTGDYLDPSEFTPTSAKGDYQNGGSWFLYEYLSYYAGAVHGYSPAIQLIKDRISKELNTDPVSHEYMATSSGISTYPTEPQGHHVYSWNTASYVIRPPGVSLPVYSNKTIEKF